MRTRKPAVLAPEEPEPLLAEPGEMPAWEEEFGRVTPIEVDVGFGKGEYLLAVSEQRPEIDFIGIDYNRQRAAKLRDRLVRVGRKNVRLACGDTAILLPRLFAPGTVRAFTINFPDPWPKRRHHRRRFITRSFGELLASRLVAGGTLTVATDFKPYAEKIIEALNGVRGLTPEFDAPGYALSLPNRVETLYERKYREMGRTNHYMRYQCVSQDRARDRH